MKHDEARARNQAVVAGLKEGFSVNSLAERFGLTKNYIRILGARAGVSGRTEGKHLSMRRRAIILELHSLGLAGGQVKRLLGLNPVTFSRYAAELGVKFRYDNSRSSASGRRKAAKMAAMYRAGMTLQQIGDAYGVSRERVRQLISKYEGINGDSGGKHIKSVAKRQQARAQQDARYLAKYGCTFEQYVEARELGRSMLDAGAGIYRTPLRAYASQRSNALRRGIGFTLTFWQWWTIWTESGKWDQRGRGKNSFVMSRFGDQGAYEAGNVYIGTASENCSVQPNNPYRKGHPDYERVMAEKRARASARRRTSPSVRMHTKHLGLPRGVTLHKSSGRYQAQATINGKNTYLGMFPTKEQAHAAYLAAVGEVNTAHKISEAA